MLAAEAATLHSLIVALVLLTLVSGAKEAGVGGGGVDAALGAATVSGAERGLWPAPGEFTQVTYAVTAELAPEREVNQRRYRAVRAQQALRQAPVPRVRAQRVAALVQPTVV